MAFPGRQIAYGISGARLGCGEEIFNRRQTPIQRICLDRGTGQTKNPNTSAFLGG
jgi:hypothetical protein